MLNHLWQSTAVALAVWLLILALRDNPARVRYAIWLSASIKFLLPFQLLAYEGSRLATRVSNSSTQFYTVIEEVTRPIRQGADLKQRILRILTRRSASALSATGRCLLFTAGMLIIAAPVGF